MGYVALYRKYRPGTFDSIMGQENVTKILKNQIKTGKISHAYIFSGTRGTGKTSAAKVFARAINCLNPQDGEQCNECEVCKNIIEGNTTDVIEMDAASNNSVENIRQIRQEVVYATVDVKYRVYIIDEVHMLTTSAFNALLKTLEEPPENVVFILATTEQHKIPVTILSRCLRFEFNRIADQDIMKRLEYVLEEEKVSYEKEALAYIAKLADGGLRDALSILERCITECEDTLTYQDIVRIVGAIDKQTIQEVVTAIENLDSIAALNSIDSIIQKGKDLRQFVFQLVESFLEELVHSKDMTPERQNRLIQIIDRLSKLDNDLKQTSKPAIVLKACIVEICNLTFSTPQGGNSADTAIVSQLNTKIHTLEEQIQQLNKKISQTPRSVATTTVSAPVIKPIVKAVKPEASMEKLEPSNMQRFSEIDDLKKSIIEKGKLKVYSALAGANLYTDDNSVLVVTSNGFAYNILKMEESIETIAQVLQENYNICKNIRVELNEATQKEENKMEKLLKDKNINYTEID